MVSEFSWICEKDFFFNRRERRGRRGRWEEKV
jgi:hypothetical protein